MAKNAADLSEEEIAALADDNVEDVNLTEEQREELELNGAPGSAKRRTLYDRFQQVNKENKKLREQLEADADRREQERQRLLEAATRGKEGGGKQEDTPEPAPARPAAIDKKALRAEQTRLLREGDFDGAAAAVAKIDEYDEAVEAWREKYDAWKDGVMQTTIKKAREDAAAEGQTKAEQAALERDIKRTTKDIYGRFPFLDHEGEKADEDAIASVNAEFKRLLAKGVDTIDALLQAAEAKGPKFAKALGFDDGKGGDDADAETLRNARGEGKDETRAERATRLAAEAARRQPPGKGNLGKGITRDKNGKIDPSKLTDEQLASLSDADMAEIDGSNRVDKD